MYKDINDIRQEFINFFKSKDHQIIKSSSLIPDCDQTLLFTNSGMNQFKNIFLGIDQPLFKRVVTVQRCVRAGGKHNDLDNVGYTERHLTFFEMLGSFSFGDYFKNTAIQFAWELLTDSNWFNLSKDRIWITVHACDDESYNIWNKQIGISAKHIVKIGNNKSLVSDSDNFWQMGNIGPCGPCSEIFYDRGHDVQGGPPGSKDECGERYVEIWNLVFMQFDRQSNGDLLLLPTLSVDTGMGLERIASVLQGVSSNYAIDIFKHLIRSICEIIRINNIDVNRSIYVIADHIRACSFLIVDGVVPSNEGQGYVLRRIIRRAVLHGKRLGVNDAFFYKLVNSLVKSMHYITDVLYEKKDYIETVLLQEEMLFSETLNKGLKLLEKNLSKLSCNDVLDGEIAFNLYDTYGFPLELTKDICLERNITVDQLKFDVAMLAQKNKAKRSSQFYISSDRLLFDDIKNIFVGYQDLEHQSQIVSILRDNCSVDFISAKEHGMVILKETPFYGESGGQIGDAGQLKTEFGDFKVVYTKKYGQIIQHCGVMYSGVLRKGETVTAIVDRKKRQCICLNHSAHHLLRAALFNILGAHVIQRGSLINDQQLRFDFSHYTAMQQEQIEAVENFVNHNIWKNLSVTTDIMSIEKARHYGAVMLLHKKYYNDKALRVVSMGNFSIELCGGTHVKNTGEIGLFIVTKECSVASGIRRIEGITGEIALSYVQQQKILIHGISKLISSDDRDILHKIHAFKSNYYKLEREIEHLKHEQVIQQSISLIKEAFFVKDVQIVIKKYTNMESTFLCNMIDYLKLNFKLGLIIFINCSHSNRVNLSVGATKSLTENNRINAVNIVRYVINIFGGKGGGRSDFAQAGIVKVEKISTLIAVIDSWLRKIL